MHHHSHKTSMLDKGIILAIFVLFAGPFLTPFSYFPVSKFYSEMLTLVMSFLIGTLMLYRAQRVLVGPAAVACGLFILFLILQIPVLHVAVPGVNLFVALEFVVGGILSVGVTSYLNGDEEMQKKLANIVVWSLVVSSTIQTLYGFLQFTGQAANFQGYILYVGDQGNQVFGNIGQKNDYVDFITMGLFGLTYLYFSKQINKIAYASIALFFLVVLSATTSRIPFEFFIIAFIATFVFVKINKNKSEMKASNKQVWMLILALFIGLFLIEALLPKIVQMISGRDVTSGLYRLDAANINQSTYRRFYEWYKDIVLFLSHPIFGIGWYRYSHDGIYIMFTDPRFWFIPANQALYTHSHNSPLNVLAETGIIGFLITWGYGFAYSLYRMFKDFNNYITLFLAFILLTIFTQGLFQYPLWYAYFLMFFILFLSFTKPVLSFNNSKMIKGGVAFLCILFVWLCGVNLPIYNQVVAATIVPHDSDDYLHNVTMLEGVINTDRLWTLPASMVLDQYNLPGTQLTNMSFSVQDQLKYTDMVADEMPYPSAIFKQIIIHKMVGDESGSTYYANILAHGYPFFKDKFAQQLQSDPRFNSQVSTILNFDYQDKSIFSKLLHKKIGQ